MNIRILGNDELARNWYRIVEDVEKALIHGSGSVTSYGLFIQCLASQAQCWVREDDFGSYKGIAITRFEQQEATKLLAITAIAGEGWFEWGSDALKILEDFARAYDCKKTIVYGRKGWARALKKHGYSEPYITLTKEL